MFKAFNEHAISLINYYSTPVILFWDPTTEGTSSMLLSRVQLIITTNVRNSYAVTQTKPSDANYEETCRGSVRKGSPECQHVYVLGGEQLQWSGEHSVMKSAPQFICEKHKYVLNRSLEHHEFILEPLLCIFDLICRTNQYLLS